MMDRLPFRVCPDYHQFYLEDAGGPHDAPEDVEQEDLRRRFAVASGLIAIYTYDPNTLSGEVIIEEDEPALELDDWDHVGECGLNVTSGGLAMRTPTTPPSPFKMIPLIRGVYRVRIHFRGLGQYTSNDPDDPDRETLEFVRFTLWLPDTNIRVLKQWEER
ncbi:MAG TPA: hypothetical protein VKE74_11095 [Gemmataceae bacterium]|nr:hypothetical protein [Gemmataceae bacterium]